MTDDRWGSGDEPTDPRGFPPLNVPGNRSPGNISPQRTPPRDAPPWDVPVTPEPEPIRAVPVSDWSATLVDLAVQSARDQSLAEARRNRLRRIALIAGAVVVVVVLAGTLGWYFITSHGSSPTSGNDAGKPWCATGTTGAVTTVSAGDDQKTPVGVVAAFLDAAIESRNAANARATLSESAVAPTVAALQQWISGLPASTSGWCGQITTTESTARLLVTVRVRTGAGSAQVGGGYTFYVSATQPGLWTIDAIVAGTS